MGAVHIGLNAEYSRSSDKPFEWAVQKAAEMGYQWFEPMVHLHAKDISVAHSDAERGNVTGTPVGCACGEGVLDWDRIVKTVQDRCPRDIVFSVECGTPEQAAKSLEHLDNLVA